MSDEFDIDSVTNYASLTTTCPNIGEISGIAIEAFSRLCKFSMFEITSISQCKKKTYGILRTDWKTHFKCEEISSVFAYVRGDTSEHIYILLNEENLLHLKELKPKFFETYVAQRYIFPDNQDIIERPTKKFEFELGFQLFTLLSDLLVFKHQKNILNYQADFILELKNNFNGDIPSIVVEIDEDEHASYTPENEKLRQSVIEAYNNRMIHISVKRASTQQDIEEIAVKYSKIIRDLARELTIDYSFEFDEEDFIRILQDNTVEPNFIKMFFDNKTGDPKFRYYMSDVGDFLGYESTRNYERLKKFLTLSPHFEENVDWKVQKAAPPHAAEQLSIEKKTVKNLGGSGLNKKIIIMTRVCFNTLCIVSRKPRSEQVGKFFAKVHDVALDYAQRLRVKAITNISNLKENKEDAKKRMDFLVEQRVDKTKLTQISKENKELQGKLDSLLEKIVELETTVEERDKSLQIVRKNIANATYEISVLEEDKRKTQKRMSVVAEELRTMKETGISSELYEKKAAELEEVIISFREYKIKYNTVVKKYNTILLKNKDIKIENEKKQEQISLLLEETQKKDKENSLLLARISELEKMIKTEQSEVKTSNILVTKPIVKTQPTTLTKPIVKTPPVTLTKPIVKTPPTTITKPILKTQPATLTKPVVKQEKDLPITKAFLEAKTMIALKDICREKSLSGYSIKKQKNELIEWMLTKL
jgi:hypothetical protein